MPRMGKTEEDWNGLKLGFSKTVAACNFKNNAQETNLFVLSYTCNFSAYFNFHSDWGRVIDKIKQNELDCRDTAPLKLHLILSYMQKGTSQVKTFIIRP